MKLRYYVARRVLLQIVVIFGVLTLTFIITKSIPANPVATMLSLEQMRDPELVKLVTSLWKLDRPIWEQYFWYISNILHGEFGRSIWSRKPVIEDLVYRFPATVELAVFGFIIAMTIAIPAGILSAIYRDKIVDHITRIYSVLGISGPDWWWGILLLLVFYLWLGFGGAGRLSVDTPVPPVVTGMYTIDSLLAGRFDIFTDALSHLILPAFAIGITSCGLTSRLVRSSMLEVLRQDYIRAARMKGLTERIVIYRHALRNALIAPVTYMGVLFGHMLGGSVFIEVIFNWNGMGQYIVNAVFVADYPAILGTTIIMALIYSTANLIVDLLYGFIDPRVRY
jgi:peptide/nickel transport system permease protein